MDREFIRRLAAVTLSAGLAGALTLPTGATAAPADLASDAGVTATSELASPTMLHAIQRDLGLTEREALGQLAREADAATASEQLSSSLGSGFAGAWLDDSQQLVVGVTDAALAEQVRAAGAEPRLVANSERALNAAMTRLDRADRPASSEVHGWQVDVATNSVVVQAAPGAVDAATEFIAASGIDADLARVEVSREAPRLLFDVVGGQAYFPGNSRCSIGFSVSGGFVTAGHCGGAGTTTRGFNGVAQGTVQGASFPTNDYGWVRVNSNWVPRPWVTQWNGTVWVVRSSNVAAINATVCRSGSTTGVFCGRITHRNQTVNYPQGTVFGLTRTTVCAEPGDSGGSFVASGISAQGVTSGGSGNCTFGGITFFQPVNEILQRFGLRLTVG
ncbi:MAG: trypsin-like serine protease [Micromonosporaceae bacterium]|nr:trypsin-like serine protease [Micromonosporaceae bacterium]